jgi:hypothetical protein
MKVFALAGLLVTLVGCATESRLPMQDLSRMRPDCGNARLQIAYLERQMRLPGNDGDREYQARAKNLIWTLRSQCDPTLQVYR